MRKTPERDRLFRGFSKVIALDASAERPKAHQFWFIEPKWANQYNGDDVGYSG